MALALVEDLLRMEKRVEVHFVTEAESHGLRRSAAIGATAHGLRFFRSRLDFPMARRLGHLVREIDPALVHVHGGRAAFFYSISGVAKRRSPIYSVHGYQFLHKSKAMRCLQSAAERHVSRMADVTVLPSEHDRGAAHRLRLLGRRCKSCVIYNGIDVTRVPPTSNGARRLVAVLGRVSYAKDPLLTVEIARILAPEGYTFRFIGGGEMEGQVRAKVRRYGLEKVIEVTGPLSREEALQRLVGAGTMLLPSRWEGLGVALMEAMAMGVPVVAAAVGGIPEVVDSGSTGLLVDGRDPLQFAAAIRQVATNDRLRDCLVATAKRVVKQRFSRRRMFREYLALYRDQLDSRGVTF